MAQHASDINVGVVLLEDVLSKLFSHRVHDQGGGRRSGIAGTCMGFVDLCEGVQLSDWPCLHIYEARCGALFGCRDSRRSV